MIPVFLLVCLTDHEVYVVQTEGTIVSQRVLNKEVSIGALILVQTLVTLVQIYTVALNPG